MSDTGIVALITASGSVPVAMTALLLNYRGFVSIDGRFGSIDHRFDSLERRMEMIQNDLKEFYKILAEYGKRISKMEDKQQ